MNKANGHSMIDWHGFVFIAWHDTSEASLNQLISNWHGELTYESSLVAWSDLRASIGEGYETYAHWQSEGWQIICLNAQGALREIDNFPVGAIEFFPLRYQSTINVNWFSLDVRLPSDEYIFAEICDGHLSLLKPLDARDWSQTHWPWIMDILYAQRLPAQIVWKHSWSPECGLPQRFSLDASLDTTLLNLGLPSSLWPYPVGLPTIIEMI